MIIQHNTEHKKLEDDNAFLALFTSVSEHMQSDKKSKKKFSKAHISSSKAEKFSVTFERKCSVCSISYKVLPDMSFYHQEKCTSALKSPIWLHFIQKKIFVRLYHSQDDKKKTSFS